MRRIRNVRSIAAGEKKIADSVFKSTIPYDRILISDALGKGDREFTLPTSYPATMLFNVDSDDGDYVIHAGDGYYGMSTLQGDKDTLIHELTHVWQGIHRGNGYVFDSFMSQLGEGDAYAYDHDRLVDWDQYNPEQQASIVEQWFHDGMKEYDPATGKGDLRFYYIKAIIRGEKVDFNWVRPPIKPLDAGTIPPEALAKSRADWTDSQLLPLLRLRFAANDVAGYGARARKVEEIFKKFDPFEANDLHRRLQARRPGDQVVRYFFEHLSTAERNKLIGILQGIYPS
jgi:hypothetical protein